MRFRLLLLAVVSGCALSALVGTATATGGSGSATACYGVSKKVIHGRFLISLTYANVDPAEAGLATCRQAREVAEHVTAMHLSLAGGESRTVEGFGCTDFVLKRKPAIYRYRCAYDAAETTTEVTITFSVSYVPG
jgi:hypothetical protein